MLKIAKKVGVFRRDTEKLRGGSRVLPKYPGSLEATYRKMFPSYLPVPHLSSMMEAATLAKTQSVKGCFSEPPRAGKTELVQAIIIDRLMQDPHCRICYLSYGALFAKGVSGEIRGHARRMGIPIDPSTRSKQDWRTGYGKGGLWATSIGGQITGKGFDLIIADDLMAGWEVAHSPVEREKVMTFFLNDVFSRRQPGASVLVIGTRWHPQDAIGQLVEKQWPETNIAAIDENGASYWPERWNLAELGEIRETMGGEDSVGWQSLYMGRPRSDSDRIFRDVTYVDKLPEFGPRRAIVGADYAYTEEKHSDYSAAVVMLECMGQLYVVDAIRMRKSEAEFREHTKALAKTWGTDTIVSSIAKTESANIALLNRDGMSAFGFPAIKSKLNRSLMCAAHWNSKRINVLRGSWNELFVKEVMNFTGNSSKHDDQVDAFVTAFDVMNQSGPIDWEFCDQIKNAAPAAYAGIQN